MIKRILSYLFKNKKPEQLYLGEFKTGLTKSEPDERDYVFVSATTMVDDLPKYQLIKNLPPIRNQGSIGSCASHAAIGAYEIQLLKNERKYLEGSELFHYYNVRKLINNSYPKDQGQTIRDCCKCLDKFGMGIEYAWPYNTIKYNESPPWYAYSIAKWYKIKRYEAVYSIYDIKKSICEEVPIIIGIKCHTSLFGLTSNNPVYSTEGRYVGGHAVVIVGYDDDKGVVIIRNSWGSSWGDKGYFRMSYPDLIENSFDWFRILI